MSEPKDIVPTQELPMIPIPELKKLTAYVNQVKKALMIKDHDYVVEGDRQYTCRSGFAKLAQGFRLSDDPPIIKVLYYDEPKTFEFDHYVRRQRKHEVVTTNIMGFEAIVKVTQLGTGRYASGEGACTVEELQMTNNMSPKWYHRCLGTAKTRAWNRAVSNFVGSADVSAEEMGLVYDEEPQEQPRKQVESEAKVVEPKVGPPPRRDYEEPKRELPPLQKPQSIQEIEYLLDGKFPGAAELFAVIETADCFSVEPQGRLDEEVVEEVSAFLGRMGGVKVLVPGSLTDYIWEIPKEGEA